MNHPKGQSPHPVEVLQLLTGSREGHWFRDQGGCLGTLSRRALGPETEPTAVTSTLSPTQMLLHVSEDEKRAVPFGP